MVLSTLVFWLVALLTVGSALMVVAARNILHAAFSLCLTFLGVAALYIFLHADFVAAAQVIVYVGGILVLILFAIMFSSNAMKETGEHQRRRLSLAAGFLIGAVVFITIVLLTRRLAAPLAAANDMTRAAYQPTAPGLGHLLMGQYLLPFEVVSVLLLAVLLGAVMIVRKELQPDSAALKEDENSGL